MKKTYLTPKAESINVETFIIAASTTEVTRNIKPTIETDDTSYSDWGNIWNN